MEDTKINIILPFLKGMLTASLVILIGTLAIVSCEYISIGKTKEEIAREMFEVDSLSKTIHMQLDSTAIDFNKIYIDAQRINNGH